MGAPAAAPELKIPSVEGDRRLSGERVRLTGPVVAGILVALGLVSLWLRTRALPVHYWIDEALSVGIASHPFSDIPSLLRQDGSPPLYYLILHVWMSLFGTGEASTHVLSLVFALACIPAAYWAGSSLFDRRTGLFCAVLASFVPYLTFYAQESRMYALVALLSLLVSASFLEAFVRRRRRYLPAFSLSLAAALYTHNWCLFLGLMSAAAFLVCVWQAPEERLALWRDGAIGFGGVLILFAPWVPTLVDQARHTGAPWALPPVFWSLSQGLYSIVDGRGVAVALLLGGGAGLWTLRRGVSADRMLRRAAICLLVLFAGTLVVAWAYAKTTPAWAFRYLAVLVGPGLLLAGLGLARGGRLGLVALALACWFWIIDPKPQAVNWKSNVAAVAAHVRGDLGTDPVVLSTQPEQVPNLAYYLPTVRRFVTPLGAVADPRIVDWRNALERFRANRFRSPRPIVDRLAPGQRVILVVPMRYQPAPPWMHLIWLDSMRWQRSLNHDRRLRLVTENHAKWTDAGVPVSARIYVRR